MLSDIKVNDILEIARAPATPEATRYIVRVQRVTDGEIVAGKVRFDRNTGLQIMGRRSFGWSDKIVRLLPPQNCTVCNRPVASNSLLISCCDEHVGQHLKQESNALQERNQKRQQEAI